MKVEELFNEWRSFKPLNIALLTMATSGLKPEEDKILAISYYDTINGTEETSFNYADGEMLTKSQQFHMITSEVMRYGGLPETTFKEQLEKVINNDVVFVYNVPFFSRFIKAAFNDEDLNVPLYDLSVVHKAVNNKYAFDNEQLNSFDDFYTACMANASPVPVGALCTQFKVSKTPVPGQLPFERMMELLKKVFSSCVSLEVQRFQS